MIPEAFRPVFRTIIPFSGEKHRRASWSTRKTSRLNRMQKADFFYIHLCSSSVYTSARGNKTPVKTKNIYLKEVESHEYQHD
jgi:hypothetical protein